MAFPVVEGVSVSSTSSSVTSHTVTFNAAAVAGELLIAIVFIDDLNPDPSFTWPAGWTELLDDEIGSVAHMAAAWAPASGGETSIVATSSGGERTTHFGIRISGWDGTTPPELSTIASGSSTAPNPTGVTASWGADDNLFIAFYGADSGAPTAYPANYADNQTSTGTTPTSAAYGGMATRNLAAATDDPGAFTNSTSDNWNAYTMVVRPAAGGGGGAATATPGLPTLTMKAQQVPVAGVIIARDDFERTAGPNTLGTPTVGPDWAAYTNTSGWDVSSGVGRLTQPLTQAFNNATFGDGDISVVESRVRAKVRFTSLPEGGFHIGGVYSRRQLDVLDEAIRTDFRVSTSGAITAENINKVSGSNTVISPGGTWVSTGLTVAANQWFWVEVEVSGQYPSASVKAKFWLDGDPIPTTWLLDDLTTGTDVDPGGTTGIRWEHSTSGSQVTDPVIFEFDELSLTALDGVQSGPGTANPGTPALTAAVLAANASGAALANPATPSLTAALLSATASGKGLASPGTPTLTIAALAATATGGSGGGGSDVTQGSGTRTIAPAENQSTITHGTMPTHAVGDRLVAFVLYKGTTHRTYTTPTGWTMVEDIDDGTNLVKLVAFTKVAASTSETFALSLSGSVTYWESNVWANGPSDIADSASTSDTTDNSTADIPGLTLDTGGFVGQVLTAAGTTRGDRYISALAGSDQSLGGINQSWAPYAILTSMVDAFTGSDPAATTATVNNGTDKSLAIRIGLTNAGAGGGTPATANPGTATATAAALAASASGAAIASPGTPLLTAAALGATATGAASSLVGTPSLTALAQSPTATGAASASAGQAAATAAAQSATARGAAAAHPGTAALTVQAQTPNASGAAQAAAGTATATVAAQSATAKGKATASPAAATLTVVVLPASANGGAGATAHPGTATASITALSSAAHGKAVASGNTASATAAALAATATGEGVASPATATATAAAQAATATGAATASPATATATAAAQAATASGAAVAQPGTPSLTIEALTATAIAGGSAVAHPGTATATAAVLAATATGKALAQPPVSAVTVVVLPSSALGDASAQPGTPALSVASLSPSARGAAQAQPGTPALSISALPAQPRVPATAHPGLAPLTSSALAAAARGAGRATPGAPALSIEVLPATGSGLQQGLAQPGTPSISFVVLPAQGQGAALTSAGLAQLTAEVLGVIGAGHLLDGPITATTTSVGYLNAETLTALRHYAATNSMPGLLAALEDITAAYAVTVTRDGLNAATTSEED